MYQIALCDDMAAELEQVEILLTKYGRNRPVVKYRTERFEDSQTLLDKIREKEFIPNLLLMDIFMTGKSGMETVQELRREGCRVPVIFLTTSKDYALEAYEVGALQYLVKPLEKEKFFHAMDIAFEVIGKTQEGPVAVKTSSGLRMIQPDQIIYCETQKNYQILYLENEEIKVRMTSRELYELLEKFSQFLRCGSSYILNLNHIVAVNQEQIHMDNEAKIYMPRNRKAEFKRKYFEFFFQE